MLYTFNQNSVPISDHFNEHLEILLPHNFLCCLLIQYVFDYQEGEVFACMSVLGWITGHTYVVYGPLCNGATTVLFEGTATFPDPGKAQNL